MKHATLIIISLVSSIISNSKYIDDINDIIKKTLKLEDKYSSFITFLLYTIIIYLLGLIVNYIIDYVENYTYNKKLEEQKSNLESQIEKLSLENKELKRHLTQNSIISIFLNPNDNESISNFNKHMKNFIDNHSDYMTVDFAEIYPQSSLLRKTKENSKVNKI